MLGKRWDERAILIAKSDGRSPIPRLLDGWSPGRAPGVPAFGVVGRAFGQPRAAIGTRRRRLRRHAGRRVTIKPKIQILGDSQTARQRLFIVSSGAWVNGWFWG